MSMFRGFATALHSLWDYKGRTTLAVLGMLVSSLLLAFLMAVVYNFKHGIESQVNNFGFRQIVAMPGQLLNHKSLAQTDLTSLLSVTTMNSNLTYQDAMNAKAKVPYVVAAVPQTETVTRAYAGKASTDVLYTGTTPDFTQVFRMPLAEGRWLDAADMKNEAQSIVLGAATKQQLFGNANAVGKTMTIKGVPFKVVGVLQSKQLVGFDFDERAYTEYPMVIDTTSVKHASMIFFSIDSQSNLQKADSMIYSVIDADHHGEQGFTLVKADQALHFLNLLMNLVTAVTIGVTGISFLVGGIGIMNVMLLVVKERTREIGLRKAVGARSYHVLIQFLSESLLVSVVGAAIGLGISDGLLRLLGHYYTAISTQMPTYVVELSLGFSIIVGLVFGLAPAIKAVRVQPVDALRYE